MLGNAVEIVIRNSVVDNMAEKSKDVKHKQEDSMHMHNVNDVLFAADKCWHYILLKNLFTEKKHFRNIL